MIKIAKPTFKVKEVFSACTDTVHNTVNKANLENCSDTLIAAETEFEDKFPKYEIYQIAQQSVVHGIINADHMKVVYDYRLVQKVRHYYDTIFNSAPYGKCPLCSVKDVETLDHYLPKMKFPSLAVTPINLIPACFRCNKGKSVDCPTSSENQTLHPYYDDVENEPWIKASILRTSPLSFQYFVSPPIGWSQVLMARAQIHFDAFHLNELFSGHANQELRGSKKQLITLFNKDPELLRGHLKEGFESRLELGINSWQAVLYSTLLNDDWFCGGGVLV